MSRNRNDLDNKLNTQKCALYIRVSTSHQIDKDSLPLQRDELINYSKYALGIDKYEIFEDAGYSAKNTDRPDYQRMMTRIRSGEFTHLVVWKIDRISRNLLDFAEMYAELKQLGVIFVSKNEQFDTSSAMGEAMLKIILVFAELERNMTSERVTAVMISRASNGEWNGGKIPYGYSYDKETKLFSIYEPEAEVVRFINNRYEEIHSVTFIARELNEKGIPTKTGKKWSATTVWIILTNPFYYGTYRYNYYDETLGTVIRTKKKKESEWIFIDNHHPAIIEKAQFDRNLQYLYENRRSNKDSAKTYVRKNTHIFAGLLECGCCAKQMQATIDKPRKDGYRPSIYLCSNKRRTGDCTNKYISDILVGPFVLNYISNIMKAQNNFGRTTSVEMFEKKLLRGALFASVTGIDRVGLVDMYDMIRSGKFSNVLSSTPDNSSTGDTQSNERDLLASEKRKKERALARLESLYLYDEDAISEREYILKKKELTEAVERIDSRLNEIDAHNDTSFSMTDAEFIEKTAWFIMNQDLQDKRFINFESTIRKNDAKIIKSFLGSVIKKIVIYDGKILSIRFKNGIEHKFLYEE